MLFKRVNNISIITQEKVSVIELIRKLEVIYNRFKNDNLIINITSLNKIPLEEIIEFLKISNDHRAENHSFVIVANNIDHDEVPDELIVVPTLQEAYDIIDMEEIERDLGI
jgi:hypothetical protein